MIRNYSKAVLEHGLRTVFDCWYDPGTSPPDGEETVRSITVYHPETYARRLVAAGLPPDTAPQNYYDQVLA